MPAPKDLIQRKKWKQNISKATSGENNPMYKGKVSFICQYCGIIKFCYLSEIKKRKYCSDNCCHEAKIIKKISVKCKYCGKIEYVYPSIAKTKKYCSPECFYANGCSNDTKKKLSKTSSREKNGNWKGGKSFEEYPEEFNDELKKKIRKRDNYKCQECWKIKTKEQLSIHHIDYDKKNNNENNLISLCKRCHGKTNFNRDEWTTYFEELLQLPKIFVSVLNEGWIRAELTFALTKWFKETKYRIYFEMSSDRPIENNRNKIVRRFLSSDCDFLLQIDADNIPAKNPLTLVKYNKDIISCPVPIYSHSTTFLNVFKLDNDGSLVPFKQEEHVGLTKIDATGTGCIMCTRRVLEMIKKPFERQYDENGIETLGLDLFFSQKAREAEFEMFTHFEYIAKHYKEIDLSNII